MKKLIAIALAILTMVSMLAACGSKDKKSSVDLSDVLSDINEEYGFSESTVQGLKILDSFEDIDRNYNISEDDISQFAAERGSSRENKLEIVILEAKSADKVDAIADELRTTLQREQSDARSYFIEQPEIIAVFDNAVVKTSGNYVYMVINAKSDEISSMIENKLK